MQFLLHLISDDGHAGTVGQFRNVSFDPPFPSLPLLSPTTTLQEATSDLAIADSHLEIPGPKKPCTALGGVGVLPPGLGPTKQGVVAAAVEPTSSAADTMTSKDYYFDSYSHFGKFTNNYGSYGVVSLARLWLMGLVMGEWLEITSLGS